MKDWTQLRSMAEAHRLTALVTRELSALPPASVPPDELRRLQDASRGVAGEALAAIEALARITSALDAAGIPSLAWKGPALAQVAWHDAALRSFADIDVVVRPADRHRARDVARGLGWTSRHAMSAAQEEAIFGGLAAWELERETTPQLLELHWEFSAKRYAGRLPVTEVLGRAERLRVGRATVRVPAAADTLVLLAQHATKHGWSTLEDVAVFAAIAHREAAAVRLALARATAVGGRRALLLGSSLAAECFGVEQGEELARAGRDDATLPGLLAQVRGRWKSEETAWRPPLAWDLAWTDGMRARARLLTRALVDPTPLEWDALQLSDAFVRLYVVVRPVRLIVDALRGRRRR